MITAGRTTKIILLWSLSLGIASCSRSNEADLRLERGSPISCDTVLVGYASRIRPIMQQHCNSCHSQGFPSGGVVTENHAGLSQAALSGKLLGSVRHDGTASPMPQGQPKLAVCDLQAIQRWVEGGAKNN